MYKIKIEFLKIRRKKTMITYEEFILNIICGHEFICEIENKIFKILNLYDDYYTIRLENIRYNISKNEDIEKCLIYNNMTLKELMDNNLIKILEMY